MIIGSYTYDENFKTPNRKILLTYCSSNPFLPISEQKNKASNISNHSNWGWTLYELDKFFLLRDFSTCQTYQNGGVKNNTVGPSKFAHFNPNTLRSSGVTSFGLQRPIKWQVRGNTVGLRCLLEEHCRTMYQRWHYCGACLLPHTTYVN
jgi:hypothetical protein